MLLYQKHSNFCWQTFTAGTDKEGVCIKTKDEDNEVSDMSGSAKSRVTEEREQTHFPRSGDRSKIDRCRTDRIILVETVPAGKQEAVCSNTSCGGSTFKIVHQIKYISYEKYCMGQIGKLREIFNGSNTSIKIYFGSNISTEILFG